MLNRWLKRRQPKPEPLPGPNVYIQRQFSAFGGGIFRIFFLERFENPEEEIYRAVKEALGHYPPNMTEVRVHAAYVAVQYFFRNEESYDAEIEEAIVKVEQPALTALYTVLGITNPITEELADGNHAIREKAARLGLSDLWLLGS